MGKSKGARIIITLECVCRNQNNTKITKNSFRYTSSKNRRNTPQRIELKKFCPNCKEHTLFKEIK